MFRLLLLFTAVPVIELSLLIKVGSIIGFWPTLGLCLITGFVGAALARSQGAGVLRRMQETMARGELPARELSDGVMIVIAGVLLLTPGFVTDIAGILLMLPPVRALVRVLAVRRLRARTDAGLWQDHAPRGHETGFSSASRDPRERQAADGPVRGFEEQEIVPPERAPHPPRPRRPPMIDIE